MSSICSRDGSERQLRSRPRIGEDDIETPNGALDPGVETIEIRQIRHVAMDGGCTGSDRPNCGVEFGLPSAGHEHACTLVREEPGRRETDAAAAPSDHRDFAVQSSHRRHP
jgi:hypothetical protein